MTDREKAIKQLEFMLEQMSEEPPTECDYIDEWLDTNRKIRNTLDMAIEALEQEPILDKIRAEIAEYGSIWVAYAITGHSDRDIENLIEGVLKQAKEQVLNIIDKYRTESEE